jgi:drug/metabolite transporter (DMT)-like permease
VTTSALLLVLISAFLHAAWSAAIKGSRDPLAFNLLQTLATLVPAVAVLCQVDLFAIPRDVWLVLAGTSIAHGFYFFFLTRALEEGDLTLVYPIARSTPALLPFIAAPWLGESVSLAGAAGIAVVVAGVWLVYSQGRVRLQGLFGRGAGFAFLTLATTVAYSLFDKAAMTGLDAVPLQTPIPRSVLVFFLLSTGGALVFLPLAANRLLTASIRETARREWRRALAAAAVSFVGYGLILEAFRSASASYVVAVRQTSVLFAVALGILLLGERPGRIRMLGAAATVLGVALIARFP